MGQGRPELRPESKHHVAGLAACECAASIDDIVVNVRNRTQWARINER